MVLVVQEVRVDPGGLGVPAAVERADDSQGADAGFPVVDGPGSAQAEPMGARHPLEMLAGGVDSTTETLPSCWIIPRWMRNRIR